MLRTRIITALWLAPLAFLLVFALPPVAFAIALAVLLLVGTWEFRPLTALSHHAAGWLLPLSQAIIFSALFYYRDALPADSAGLLAGICSAWLLMFLRLGSYQPGKAPDRQYRSLGFVCALVAITGAWYALTVLRGLDQGQWWILILLLIIWSADIGAYFAGRALGRRKLAPQLSPGKTVEGLVGGLLAAATVGWAATALLPVDAGARGAWLLVAALTALVSVGGDLFISLHKRTSGCKDSGNIFPGHGGVLDRLDSLLAGAPFFALGVVLLRS